MGDLPGTRGRRGPTMKAAFAAERGLQLEVGVTGCCVGPIPVVVARLQR